MVWEWGYIMHCWFHCWSLALESRGVCELMWTGLQVNERQSLHWTEWWKIGQIFLSSECTLSAWSRNVGMYVACIRSVAMNVWHEWYLALLQVIQPSAEAHVLECGYYCNASATIQLSDGFQYTDKGQSFLGNRYGLVSCVHLWVHHPI